MKSRPFSSHLQRLGRPLLAVTVASTMAFAANAGAATAEDELRQFVENVRTLSGHFSQTQTDEHGELLSSGAGTMAISRPGRFRWAYEKPYSQLMVCDGAKIWAYDPDIAQVTVRPAGEALAGTPAELLAQKSRLAETFRIEDRGDDHGLRAIHLEPKAKENDFKSIDLWLKNGVPQRLRFSDPLGGITQVELRDLQVNPVLNDKDFQFVPPKGVEVVEGAAGR